ncbi:MAG TPA: hypothetical protein VI547_08995 [Anaerolineales bacterium]|nr:hypothetical protein [Anaerolineales bacterium]
MPASTATPSATTTPSPSPSKTPSATPNLTPSWTPSPTASPTALPSSTPTPSHTPTLPYTLTPASSSLTGYCRTDDPSLWLRPWLQLLSACEVMSGTIVWTGYNPGDGDFTFDTKLDPGQEGYLNQANIDQRGGALHCEIEPAEAYLGYPSVGMHIVMVGAWTYDTDRYWNEIHPIWYWTETPK